MQVPWERTSGAGAAPARPRSEGSQGPALTPLPARYLRARARPARRGRRPPPWALRPSARPRPASPAPASPAGRNQRDGDHFRRRGLVGRVRFTISDDRAPPARAAGASASRLASRPEGEPALSPHSTQRSLGKHARRGRGLTREAPGTAAGRARPRQHGKGVAISLAGVGGASGGSGGRFEPDPSLADGRSPGVRVRGGLHRAAAAPLHYVPALSRGLGAVPEREDAVLPALSPRQA